ncbi:MAG: YrdB family protein [Acidimicrobiales bacterium]
MNTVVVQRLEASVSAPVHGGLHGPARRPGTAGAVAMSNLGLRFCIELATLAALGYWGASVDAPAAVRASLAVAAPLAAAVAWSRLLAPRAPRRLVGPTALGVELSIFAIATWALVSSGVGAPSVIYASLAVANAFTTRALGQLSPVDGARPPEYGS